MIYDAHLCILILRVILILEAGNLRLAETCSLKPEARSLPDLQLKKAWPLQIEHGSLNLEALTLQLEASSFTASAASFRLQVSKLQVAILASFKAQVSSLKVFRRQPAATFKLELQAWSWGLRLEHWNLQDLQLAAWSLSLQACKTLQPEAWS